MGIYILGYACRFKCRWGYCLDGIGALPLLQAAKGRKKPVTFKWVIGAAMLILVNGGNTILQKYEQIIKTSLSQTQIKAFEIAFVEFNA